MMSVLATIISLLEIPAILIGFSNLFGLISISPQMTLFTVIWFFSLLILEIILTPNVKLQILKQFLAQIYFLFKAIKKSDKTPQTGKYILPFEGTWLVINGGISRKSSHSWSIQSQRYAYDFIMIDDNGKSYKASKKKPENYHCFGENILAPADGVVVEINDTCAESKLFGSPLITDSYIKDIRGNYIVIRHEWGEYSCLAHLKRDSILVSVGQIVKSGEIIAQCGNSGNTSEPHLHFQVQSDLSFFFCEGLPINFDNDKTKCTVWDKYKSEYLRKVLVDEIGDGFITRGTLVSNKF